ncbi:MAG: tetratricopeptide repeat protein [Planctomycetia bacterium]|nr:tetratricopeptide repeat protein [Planctomycetia bacterium]
MTKPAPQPGLPGLGGGNATRPGGGFANRPALPPRPGQIGGGSGPGGASTLPGQLPGNRPGLGPTTKPSFPKPGLPGGGGGGVAGGNRPTTLPGSIGGDRPGGGGGTRPGLGNVNRPTPLPGDLGGNRPGGGAGNRPTDLTRPVRPGIGGNRPTTLPGDLGHWNGGGNWNGDHHRPGRPGIGGNRPGIGNGNWNSGNFNGNNFNNINVGGGGWGYGGGGYGGWGYGGGYGGFNNGWVNPHYGNWYNGGWNGGWGGYNGGWWAPFAAGAATWGVLSSIGSWGLGYGSLGYGAAGYVNPYYASMPATVVASSPYDYSQPIVVNNYIPSEAAGEGSAEAAVEQTDTAAATPSPSDAAVDDALAKFKAGDYAAALAGFDKALKLSPNDSVIHEVRALALFALGRYPEAAAALNAVLVSAPGMDWTTISNVYGSVDAYTTHLRRLEDVCRSKPDDAAAHFVLAYHYLVGGHADMAAAALRVVVAKQPGDVVAKRMLEAIEAAEAKDDSAPAPSADSAAQKTDAAAAAEQPLPEIDLVGTWKATSGTDTIELVIAADSTFSWKAKPKDKPAVDLKGTIETAADAIALVSKSAGTMVAKVAAKGPDAFEFSLPSAPKDTKPLLFARQP